MIATPRGTRSLRSCLATEFGHALHAMVAETPGAMAAVVSDEDGDAIDYAHDPDELDALDVQLLAAQLGQSLFRLEASAATFNLQVPVVLVETQQFGVLASPVGGTYIVAMLTERHANMGRAFDRFRAGRETLHALLR